MIKKLLIGAAVIFVAYFFILPWLGKMITFLLVAAGVVIFVYALVQGGKAGNGGPPV